MFKVRLLFICTLFLANCMNDLSAGKDDASSLADARCKASQRNEIKTDFHNAAINDDPMKIEELIDIGMFHPDARELLSGETALHKAAYYGSTTATYTLLSKGAQILYKNGTTETVTPVHTAVLRKNASILALLWHVCGNDELFNAPNKINNLRPSDLAQQIWGTTLEAIIKEGENSIKLYLETNGIDKTFEDIIKEIETSRRKTFQARKINDSRFITDYKIKLVREKREFDSLIKELKLLERTYEELVDDSRMDLQNFSKTSSSEE